MSACSCNLYLIIKSNTNSASLPVLRSLCVYIYLEMKVEPKHSWSPYFSSLSLPNAL